MRPFGDPLIHLLMTDSTMVETERLAAAGADEGLVVWADAQTAGRGRGNHCWHSVVGAGLEFSLLLRSSMPAVQHSALPLAIGIAICTVLRASTGLDVRLKWPNDLMLDGSKLGGILVKSQTAGEHVAHLIVGIGINVFASPHAIDQSVTDLQSAGLTSLDRYQILQSLLAGIQMAWEDFACQNGRFPLARYHELLHKRMEQVSIETGGVHHSGILLGVDTDGALLLRQGEKISRFLVGIVTDDSFRAANKSTA